MVKHRDAFAPPEHGRDTSLRVRKPVHDRGCESAAHGRVVDGGCELTWICGRPAHTWCGTEQVCATVRQCICCQATKTFGATLRRLSAPKGAFAPLEFGYDMSSRAREQEQDRGSMSKTCRARVRD